MGKGIKAGKRTVQHSNEKTVSMKEYIQKAKQSYENGWDSSREYHSKLYSLLFQLAVVELYEFTEEDMTDMQFRIAELMQNIVKDFGSDVPDIKQVHKVIEKKIIDKMEEIEMGNKSKYPDEVLIKNIEKGKTDDEILKGVPLGSQSRLRKRLANLRKTHGASEVYIPELSYGKQKAEEYIDSGAAKVDVKGIMAEIDAKNKKIAREVNEATEAEYINKEQTVAEEVTEREHNARATVAEDTTDKEYITRATAAEDITDGECNANATAAEDKILYIEKARKAFENIIHTHEEVCNSIMQHIALGETIPVMQAEDYNITLAKIKGMVE